MKFIDTMSPLSFAARLANYSWEAGMSMTAVIRPPRMQRVRQDSRPIALTYASPSTTERFELMLKRCCAASPA
jgi:hypothetical protein